MHCQSEMIQERRGSADPEGACSGRPRISCKLTGAISALYFARNGVVGSSPYKCSVTSMRCDHANTGLITWNWVEYRLFKARRLEKAAPSTANRTGDDSAAQDTHKTRGVILIEGGKPIYSSLYPAVQQDSVARYWLAPISPPIQQDRMKFQFRRSKAELCGGVSRRHLSTAPLSSYGQSRRRHPADRPCAEARLRSG
jgi:hypothetical protein